MHLAKPLAAAFGAALLMLLPSCGHNNPGRMEWVTPTNPATTPRVGTVYCIRGWKGVYSSGIDAIAQQLEEQGVTAHLYMPEQFPELAKTLVAQLKAAPHHEPIVFIGHSRGVDTSIIIARELDKAGIPVDMIVGLDSVDEKVVPKNVKITWNYWMPGLFPGTNLLRGIPLEKAPGSTGILHNVLLLTEGANLREFYTTHVDIDKAPKLQKALVNHILEVCPPRNQWHPSASVSQH